MNTSTYPQIKGFPAPNEESDFKNEKLLKANLKSALRIKGYPQPLNPLRCKGFERLPIYLYSYININACNKAPRSVDNLQLSIAWAAIMIYRFEVNCFKRPVDALSYHLSSISVNQKRASHDLPICLDDFIGTSCSIASKPCWTLVFGRVNPLFDLRNLDDFSVQRFTWRPSIAALDSPGWGLRCRLSGPVPLAAQQPDLVSATSLNAITQTGESSAALGPLSTGAGCTIKLAFGSHLTDFCLGKNHNLGLRWGANSVRCWTHTLRTRPSIFPLGSENRLSMNGSSIRAITAPGRRSFTVQAT